MSDLNLPPDAQADHSGPIADPDSFGGDDGADGSFLGGDDETAVPEPGAVPPPD